MKIEFFYALAIGCFLATALGTGAVLFWLRRRGFVDVPNQRSNHVIPTPRGGGLAVVPIICAVWAGLAAMGIVPLAAMGAAAIAALLCYLCWRDDRHGLPVLTRLGLQVLSVCLGCSLLHRPGHVFGELLPVWADLAATAFVWVWFVNLFNFMDGIDGIAATETTTIGLGICLVDFVIADPNDGGAPLGLVAAAAALGFLLWNWHPAKLFLGDSGSVPLGFLLGWLLLDLASRGFWASALIIPLYYLVDATWTLGRRALARKRVWEAHREHFYQRAVQAGHSHAWVVLQILPANLMLVVLSLLAIRYPWINLALSIVVVVWLLHRLRKPSGIFSDV